MFSEVIKNNKGFAVIVMLIILLVLYLKFGRKEKATGSKKTKKSGKKGKREHKAPAKKGRRRPSDDEDPGDGPQESFSSQMDKDDSDSSSESEDADLREDAEELYNYVHEGMCNGMQQSEFEELVDDLADSFHFIELKQLYNQCIDKNMDPAKTITVRDYINVLKKE